MMKKLYPAPNCPICHNPVASLPARYERGAEEVALPDVLHKYTNSQTHTNLQIYKYTDTVVLRPAKYVRGTKEADVRN